MARLPLVDVDEMPTHYDAQDRLPGYEETRHAKEDRLRRSTLLRALANNVDILRLHTNAFLDLWREELTGLSGRETELVILTVGRTFKSKNEWNSHLQNAVNQGVTEDELVALADMDLDRFPENEAALVRYVEAICEMAVTDELHQELSEHYDDRTVVGIDVLTGYYTLCAVVIDALIPEDEQADTGEVSAELGFERVIAPV